MQIYVGNLSPEITDADLRSMFEPFGAVRSATIALDRKTGKSEGYGLVEMSVKSEARAAVEALRGKDMSGRPLRARILKPDDPLHSAARTAGRESGGGGAIWGGNASRGTARVRRGSQRGS